MMKALPTVRPRARRPRATFEERVRDLPALLPRAGHPADRPVRPQPRHARQQPAQRRRLPGADRAGAEPRRLAAGRRLRHRVRRQVAERPADAARPRRPAGASWSGLVGEGGEGLSSFYDFDVFEADGTPRHYGNAPSDYQTDVLTREYALPLIGAQAVEPGPFFLWLAYHPPHDGIGRDDAAGRRCSDGAPGDARGPAERDPAAALRAQLPARRRSRGRPPSTSATSPTSRSSSAAAAALRSRTSRRSTATTAAGWRRCWRSTTASARSSSAARHRAAREHGARLPRRPGRDGRRAPDQARQERPLRGGDPGPADDPRARDRPEPVISAPVGQHRPRADAARARRRRGAAPSSPARPTAPRWSPVLARRPPDADRVVLIEGRDNVAESRHGFKVRSYVGVRTSRYAYIEYRRANYGARTEGIAAPIGAGRTTDAELYDLAPRSRPAAQPRTATGATRPRAGARGLLGRPRALRGSRVRE